MSQQSRPTMSMYRGGWTATRKASWEICMRFADWRHSRVDLSEVNISRIWKFSKERDYRAVILQENSTVQLCLYDSFYDVAFTDPSILF